jgi:hypothetical protein
MRSFVTASTEPKSAVVKLTSEKWLDSKSADISESELFRRDQMLLEMWPEACRRTGVEVHEFPIGVIKRWREKMGWAN